MKPEWTVKIKEEVVKQYDAGFLEVRMVSEHCPCDEKR